MHQPLEPSSKALLAISTSIGVVCVALYHLQWGVVFMWIWWPDPSPYQSGNFGTLSRLPAMWLLSGAVAYLLMSHLLSENRRYLYLDWTFSAVYFAESVIFATTIFWTAAFVRGSDVAAHNLLPLWPWRPVLVIAVCMLSISAGWGFVKHRRWMTPVLILHALMVVTLVFFDMRFAPSHVDVPAYEVTLLESQGNRGVSQTTTVVTTVVRGSVQASSFATVALYIVAIIRSAGTRRGTREDSAETG